MRDLDEYELKELAEKGSAFEHQGVFYVPVPRDLLQRVVRHFDCDHVRRDIADGRRRPE